MKVGQPAEKLIEGKLKPFDVVVVSRYQISAPWIGISKAYHQMIQSLNSNGLKVCLVSEGANLSSIDASPLLTIKQVPASRKKIKSLIQMGTFHPMSFWLSEVTDFLKYGSHVVAPIVGIQTAVFRIPKSGTQTYISTLHTPYSKKTPWGFMFQLIQRNTLIHSDIQIANSKTIVKSLKLESSNTIILIPHSIQLRKPAKLPKVQHRRNPIWIGQLTYRKGVDRLLLLVFLNRKNSRIKIVWSNSKFDFFSRRILNGFAKAGWCELAQNLTETELNNALANSSYLVSTTRFESFGMTIIEAAQAKTGVVGIWAPGVTETLPESTGGAIYFNNVRELAGFLESNSDIIEIDNLGTNAFNYVETTYDFDKISALWGSLFSK
jgi:glycosyltransferase involved in cell wall biosynthesis